MNSRKPLAFALVLGLGMLAGCSGEQPNKPVSFQKNVYPILKANCAECHTAPDGEGYTKSGLALSTYEELMKGTKMGPIIIPGQSLNSSFNRLIEGRPVWILPFRCRTARSNCRRSNWPSSVSGSIRAPRTTKRLMSFPAHMSVFPDAREGRHVGRLHPLK